MANKKYEQKLYKNLRRWLVYIAKYKEYKIYLLMARNAEKTVCVYLFRKIDFPTDDFRLYREFLVADKPVGFVDDKVGFDVVTNAMILVTNYIDKTPNKSHLIPARTKLSKDHIIKQKVWGSVKEGDATTELIEFVTFLDPRDKDHNKLVVHYLDKVEQDSVK